VQRHLRVVESGEENAVTLESLLQSAYRYALSLAHDRTEAEDLLQDACMAVVRGGSTWNKPYLFATIRNRFIDRYRRNRKILFVPLDSVVIDDEFREDDLPDFRRGRGTRSDKFANRSFKADSTSSYRVISHAVLLLAAGRAQRATQIGGECKRDKDSRGTADRRVVLRSSA
jgi:RNA polymerase sigma factor (sigma-70 family)